MFKYCAWYRVRQYDNIIKRNALLFGTQLFPAHITINSNLSQKEAKRTAEAYQHITPTFEPYGPAIQTKTKVCMGVQLFDFYAIQQPLKVNGYKTNIHISLAYKSSPFSEMDIAVSNMDIKNISELDVCIADCRTDPKNWKITEVYKQSNI